jgi:hemerythrin
MALLQWREEFSIGIAEVDHEHRELIDLINSLHERLVHDQARAGIGEFLGELHARISAHFALEEKIMRSRRYAGFAEHKQDHERLLDEIRDIMDGYELHGRYDAGALGAALDAWFGEHFRTRDAHLHTMLAGSRESERGIT